MPLSSVLVDRDLIAIVDKDLPDILTDTDTDNANTIIRLAVLAAKKAAYHGSAADNGIVISFQDKELALRYTEIAERLARTASYIAAAERSTKIDDSGQSDDSDGSHGPDDPSPDPYDPVIKPNGKAVDGTYSEP